MSPTSRLARLKVEVVATFVLALPIVIGQLLTIAMNVIDTVLAGHLGTRVLAAVAMGNQVWVLALLIVIGVMLAVTPAVAQLDGAGRRAEVSAVFRQALWLAMPCTSMTEPCRVFSSALIYTGVAGSLEWRSPSVRSSSGRLIGCMPR